MKLKSSWLDSSKFHQYCLGCLEETVEHVKIDGKSYDKCTSCNNTYERSIVIDPKLVWWVDEDREYWHESAGVFIRDPEGSILFFERVAYPFSHTIPAGHVDKGETGHEAASREVKEEVNIEITKLRLLATEDVWGDSCRRGADVHRWHAYIYDIPERPKIEVSPYEGHKAVWLSAKDALDLDLVFPVRYFLDKYEAKLSIP